MARQRRPDSGSRPYPHLVGGWIGVVALIIGVVALIVLAVNGMTPDEETAPPTTVPGTVATSPPTSVVPTTATTAPSVTTSDPPDTTAAPTTTVPSNEFHVSPEGTDENPGTTEEPWGTLSHALAQLRAGDTLVVGDGTYRERVRVNVQPGTAEAPITVQAASGAEPVVEGLFWIYRPDYWLIDGINVTWDESEGDDEEHMVKITDGVGWVLQNSELWGAESFAALLIAASGDGAPSDWTVAGNCIHDTYEANDTNQDQLIYVNTGDEPTNGLIQGNLLFNADNGSAVKLGGSSEDEGGAHAVTVRGNTILNAAQGVLVAWGASDNVISGNLFGGTDDGYGHIRGFELSGEGNVASDNGGDEHEPFILNDEDYVGVGDGGGNRGGLSFDASEAACDFRPDGDASAYGVQADLAPMPGG